MIMNSYLSVIGIALSFASLVPAFSVKKTRMRLLGVGVAIALIGVIGVQLSRSLIDSRRLDKVRLIVKELFCRNNSLTIEQVLLELNRGSRSMTVNAVDFMARRCFMWVGLQP